MTLDPAALRATAEAVQERKRQELAEADRKRQAEYQAEVDTAMAQVPLIIRNLESTIECQARTGATHYVSQQHDGTESGQRYDDLVRAPLEAVVTHFRKAGFVANIALEHTTDWYRGEAGPGPTKTNIVIDWSAND